MTRSLRVVAISDTHNLHRHWGRSPWGDLPEGDVLLHAGDVTTHGTEEEYQTFLEWFRRQPHEVKLFIAGNHDRCLEGVAPFCEEEHELYYLKDSLVEISGVRFYGTPAHRKFETFPFGLDCDTGEDLEFFRSFPLCDVLVTHGPAMGHCDDEPEHRHDHLGMPGLTCILEGTRFPPTYHVCGHLHKAQTRVSRIGGTTSLNCSVHRWLWKKEPNQLPVTFQVRALIEE